MIRFGICFSGDFKGTNPLGDIGRKLPVYLRLLEFCQRQNWEVYVTTRKTYEKEGVFNGAWLFSSSDGKFVQVPEKIKIDIVYDRTGGGLFPPQGDSLRVVNVRKFKILCWDKWAAYKETGKYMPTTFWVGGKENLKAVLQKVGSAKVVLKPFNGLKGIGIFIGEAKAAYRFDFAKRKYIAQEFIDTSGGIENIVKGFHDLRVAIVNGKPVWCHVRTPKEGSLKANVAEGGTFTEVDYKKVPDAIKKIVDEISKDFYLKYDNPAYSLDFGMEKGKPFIFEINDQIGFPLPNAKGKDNFLNELINNFESKIT